MGFAHWLSLSGKQVAITSGIAGRSSLSVLLKPVQSELPVGVSSFKASHSRDFKKSTPAGLDLMVRTSVGSSSGASNCRLSDSSVPDL